MCADGQAVLDGDSIAQIHNAVNGGEALALGDAGQQRLNGAEELVGVDVQRAEGLTVGHDGGALLGLHALEVGLASGDVLLEHSLQFRLGTGVVKTADGHRTEAGRGELGKDVLTDCVVHGDSPLGLFFFVI